MPGFVSGEYYDAVRPQGTQLSVLACWSRQVMLYVAALVVMKLVVLGLLGVIPIFVWFGDWLLDLFGTHRASQVVFVMALFPLAMNMLQFWIVDSMLQHTPTLDYVAVGERVAPQGLMLDQRTSGADAARDGAAGPGTP